MRKYISIALLLAFAMMMPMTVGAKKAKKEVAFQMYSVRNLIGDPGKYAKNQAKVLSDLKKMGYTAVEAANYGDGKLYGVTPEQFKADIEAAGLKVLSSHTTRNLSNEELASRNFTDALKWWDECIDAHKRAGCKYIVIPWSNVPGSVKDLQTMCDFYTEVGKRVNAAGMKLGYHNHSHEFQKVENKEVMLDYMIKHIAPEYMFFQMDVYWVMRASASPVEYFQKYPGRWAMYHIKDHKEIGQSGMVGFDAIFKNYETAGMEEWVLELENPSTPDVMKGMQISIDYILESDFIKKSYSK